MDRFNPHIPPKSPKTPPERRRRFRNKEEALHFDFVAQLHGAAREGLHFLEADGNGTRIVGTAVKERILTRASVNPGTDQNAHFVDEARFEKVLVDASAAHDRGPLHAEFRGEEFESAGEGDAVPAAGDPGNAEAVKKGEVGAAHGFAREDEARRFVFFRLLPEKPPVRVDHDFVARGVDLLRESFVPERGVSLGRFEFARERELEFGRRASRNAGGNARIIRPGEG